MLFNIKCFYVGWDDNGSFEHVAEFRCCQEVLAKFLTSDNTDRIAIEVEGQMYYRALDGGWFIPRQEYKFPKDPFRYWIGSQFCYFADCDSPTDLI